MKPPFLDLEQQPESASAYQSQIACTYIMRPSCLSVEFSGFGECEGLRILPCIVQSVSKTCAFQSGCPSNLRRFDLGGPLSPYLRISSSPSRACEPGSTAAPCRKQRGPRPHSCSSASIHKKRALNARRATATRTAQPKIIISARKNVVPVKKKKLV